MASTCLDSDTIAAIATAVAPGQGGIAIVRLSGPASIQAGKSVVCVSGNQEWLSHHVLYGHVMDDVEKVRIDEVLVLLMKAPRSFTGEDVVEIHCHGGLIVVQRVLQRCLAQPGVRRALPGEFSQRAVLNGRVDLTRAEAISDLIAARSKKAAQLAMEGVDGGIQRRITSLRDKLLDFLSELEARVDFEDELPALDGKNLIDEILKVRDELSQLVKDADLGAIIRNGLKVAIIGRPNVGKSSLMNRLSRCERAIVTDFPGTTRDLVESDLILLGIPIKLLDTAGVRSTEDPLEKLGIEKSYQALRGADVVVMLFDLNSDWTAEDQFIYNQIPEDLPRLVVGNKADIHMELKKSREEFAMNKNIIPDALISALTGEGEEEFVRSLLRVAGVSQTNNLVVSLNMRQRDLADQAVKALDRMTEVVEQKLPWDFWTIDLRQAIHSLGEITGDEVTEAILERIFSRFCIGK